MEEKEVTSKEGEELGEGMTDSEIQEKSAMMHEEEKITLPHSADWAADVHQGEERLPEDTTVQESTDKVILILFNTGCSLLPLSLKCESYFAS